MLSHIPLFSQMSSLRPLRISRLAAAAAALAAATAFVTAPSPVHAAGSELSTALSLPVAVSVAAPVAVLSAGAVLTVVAIEATAAGTVWVLQRASDGVKASIRFAGKVVGGVALSVGATVTVIAVGTGMLLSVAGEAIAFIPNQIGAALLHNERITPKEKSR